jgi:hypothetical protein
LACAVTAQRRRSRWHTNCTSCASSARRSKCGCSRRRRRSTTTVGRRSSDRYHDSSGAATRLVMTGGGWSAVLREPLQDRRIQSMFDWESSGRRFKSCQPDHSSRVAACISRRCRRRCRRTWQPAAMRFPGLTVDGQRRVGGDEMLVTHFVPEVVGNRGSQRRVVFCDAVKLRPRWGVPRWCVRCSGRGGVGSHAGCRRGGYLGCVGLRFDDTYLPCECPRGMRSAPAGCLLGNPPAEDRGLS